MDAQIHGLLPAGNRAIEFAAANRIKTSMAGSGGQSASAQ